MILQRVLGQREERFWSKRSKKEHPADILKATVSLGRGEACH